MGCSGGTAQGISACALRPLPSHLSRCYLALVQLAELLLGSTSRGDSPKVSIGCQITHCCVIKACGLDEFFSTFLPKRQPFPFRGRLQCL